MSFIGRHISSLPTPALIVDKDKFEANCRKMLDLAKTNKISLRAQTKTHKTVEGAVLQTGGTRRKIVTSTLVESEMYADAGFEDILYGFPYIAAHQQRAWKLRQRLEEFHLMVANLETAKELANCAPPEGKTWSLFLKVDCGNKRAGVRSEDAQAVKIVEFIHQHPKLSFAGIYAHCGNSYGATSLAEVERVRDSSRDMMLALKTRLEAAGLSCPAWGIGSTPSCSHKTDGLSSLTEIHPGAYVFYDAQQTSLGSCQPSEVAGKVLTRVLGHYPERGQLLVDAGFTSLTKQGKGAQAAHPKMIAPVVDCPDLMVSDMTQEIGFVQTIKDGESPDYDRHPLGALLQLVPYHACATAACHPVYYLHNSEGIVVEEWKPCRGW